MAVHTAASATHRPLPFPTANTLLTPSPSPLLPSYVYNVQGNLGLDGKPIDWATMIIHTLLAFSSILFRVPKKRLKAKPMVIYEGKANAMLREPASAPLLAKKVEPLCQPSQKWPRRAGLSPLHMAWCPSALTHTHTHTHTYHT